MGAVSEAEFAEVYLGRSRALRRTAYLLCGDWHRAEDLVQASFVRLYVAWPRIRDVGAVDAYLRQTLVHIYLDDARRMWHGERPTAELPDDLASPGAAIEDRLLLVAVLAEIPPRQRACLVLRYFEDCSVESTARALGCSTGTVKSNTARGLDALRAQLTEHPDLAASVGDSLRSGLHA